MFELEQRVTKKVQNHHSAVDSKRCKSKVNKNVMQSLFLHLNTNVVQTGELQISIEGWNGVVPDGESEKSRNCSANMESFKSSEKQCERSKEVGSAERGDWGRGGGGNGHGGGGGGGLGVVNWTGDAGGGGGAFSWEPYLRSNAYKGTSTKLFPLTWSVQ